MTNAQKDFQHLQQQTNTEKKRLDQEHKAINQLWKNHKKWKLIQRSIVKPKEPVMLLARASGKVEFYENVKGNTFIVPLEDEKAISWGEPKQIQRERRVIYFTAGDLRDFPYGNNTFKGYICHEDDAMPWRSDVKVWSEGLEKVIEAIQINRARLEGNATEKTLGGWTKLIIGVAAAIALLMLANNMFPGLLSSFGGTETVTIVKETAGGIVPVLNGTGGPTIQVP